MADEGSSVAIGKKKWVLRNLYAVAFTVHGAADDEAALSGFLAIKAIAIMIKSHRIKKEIQA